MKIKLKTYKFIAIVAVLAAVFVVAQARAAGGAPEIMTATGGTTITQNGATTYSGLGGAYAVLNNSGSTDYGFNYSVANGLFQPGCLSQSFIGVTSPCFSLGTGLWGITSVGNGRLMTSRTSINGSVVYEMPALLYDGINIYGDVSGNLGYLLKFWGNNLYRGTDSTQDAAWKLGGYVLNPDAQATWGSDKFSQYRQKLTTLAGSGTTINAASLAGAANLYLQASGTNITTDGSEGDAANYPDGKVWVISDANLALNTSITFHGKGTLIIRSRDFSVASSKNFQPDPADPTSRLGIIVLDDGAATPTGGNCTFSGNNDPVQIMMLCTKTLSAGPNADFKGSFVANNFSINSTYPVKFEYDPAFDDNQPPGFRNLEMPSATETGNQ